MTEAATTTATTPQQRRRQLRFATRVIFAGGICVIGLIALFLLGQTMSSVTRSEETADVLNVAATLPGDLQGSVEWLPDPLGLPRRMEPLTRDDITDAWLRGWSQIAILANTGDSAGLEEYFTNSAQEALLRGRQGWSGLPVQQIGHELELTFYSEDGSVAAFTATESRVLRRTPTGDNAVWFDAVESFDVVVLLEDGNWRMQHWVRRSADGVWWSEQPPPARAQIRGRVTAISYLPQDATAATLFAEPAEDDEPIDDAPAEPDADTAPPSELAATDPESGEVDEGHAEAEEPPPLWSFDPDVIEADFRLIRSLGVNAIQVPLNYETLNGRDISVDELDRVELLMDIAATEGIKVIVTLFDGRDDHRVLNWDADEDHLAAIVSVLAQHPALLVWDLQQNADTTIGVAGVDRDLLYAWVGHMSRALRSIDDVTPTMITWSTVSAAAEAPDLTDMISVQAPVDPADIESMVADIGALHPERQILLTGASRHTHVSWLPGGQTEKEQAVYVADVLAEQRRLGVTGAVIGPLWDLSAPPADAGRLPIGLGARMQSGLVRADATLKPAVLLFDPEVDLGTVNRPTFADGVRKPFHVILLMLLAGIVGLVVLTRRCVGLHSLPLPRRRRRRERRNNKSEENELNAEHRADANPDPIDDDLTGGTIPLISRPLPPSMAPPTAPSNRTNGLPPETSNGNGHSPAASSLAIAPPPLIQPAITTEQFAGLRTAPETPTDDATPESAPSDDDEADSAVEDDAPIDDTSPLGLAPPVMRAPSFEPPRPSTPEAAPTDEATATTPPLPLAPLTAPADESTPTAAAPLTPAADEASASLLPSHIPMPKFNPPGMTPPPLKLPDALPGSPPPTAAAAAPTAPAAIAPAAIAPTMPSVFETNPAQAATAESSAAAAAATAPVPVRPDHQTSAIVDLANVNDARDRFGPQFASRAGTPLVVLPFVQRAVCDALIHYPEINGHFPKINLAIVSDGSATDGSVIADADYKTLRILALESAFPGRPEADPTFTIFTAEPTASTLAAMKTDMALVIDLSASQSSAHIKLIWKTERSARPTDAIAFVNRVASTLDGHNWDAEMS